jgi:hypothetical protein
LNRHFKRCSVNATVPSRRKSCTQCADAKVRCSSQHPVCFRCVEKDLLCGYHRTTTHADDILRPSAAMAPETQIQAEGLDYSASALPAKSVDDKTLPNNMQASQMRLPGLIRRADSTQTHSMNFTIRVLRTYPQIVSRNALPPFIHRRQLSSKVPIALKRCFDLLATWGQDDPSREAVVCTEVHWLYKVV